MISSPNEPQVANPSRATTDSTPSKKVDRVGRGRNERNDLSSTSEFIGFFPAGLQNVIESVLEANSAKLLDIDQSAVRLSHQDSLPTQLIPLFKNVFSIEASTTRGPPPHSVSRLTAQLAKRGIAGIRKDETFRIMVHIDDQLTSIDRARRTTLEIMIESLTGTRVHSRGGGMEYWIIGRKGRKNLFLGTRLRNPAAPAPNKGELAPNLASPLITLSEPRPDEDFIDPFSGSGGIVRQRLKWPAARVHFNDLKTHAPGNLMYRPSEHLLLGHSQTTGQFSWLFLDDCHRPSVGKVHGYRRRLPTMGGGGHNWNDASPQDRRQHNRAPEQPSQRKHVGRFDKRVATSRREPDPTTHQRPSRFFHRSPIY